MRKLAIATALASTVLATPALARDGSGYVGVEGGVMIVEDLILDYDDSDGVADDDDIIVDEAIDIDHKTGFDIDAVAGYDFGWFRLEGELAYKRAGLDEVFINALVSGLPSEVPLEADGNVTVLSGMINGLLDFGDDAGWSGYVGGGIGLANVSYDIDVDDAGLDADDSDSGIAWQLIAGVRTAITPNLDLGLKYRMFTARRNFGGELDGVTADLDGKFRSHSLLLSLIYNLAAPVVVAPPPPPPPPPPPAPATQTCPDGTVILATDVCPAPPPPPPPPPPAPVRG
jgi:opacity protein-like surface antigen